MAYSQAITFQNLLSSNIKPIFKVADTDLNGEDELITQDGEGRLQKLSLNDFSIIDASSDQNRNPLSEDIEISQLDDDPQLEIVTLNYDCMPWMNT